MNVFDGADFHGCLAYRAVVSRPPRPMLKNGPLAALVNSQPQFEVFARVVRHRTFLFLMCRTPPPERLGPRPLSKPPSCLSY